MHSKSWRLLSSLDVVVSVRDDNDDEEEEDERYRLRPPLRSFSSYEANKRGADLDFEFDVTASIANLAAVLFEMRPFRPPAYRKALYKALYVLLLGGTPFLCMF